MISFLSIYSTKASQCHHPFLTGNTNCLQCGFEPQVLCPLTCLNSKYFRWLSALLVFPNITSFYASAVELTMISVCDKEWPRAKCTSGEPLAWYFRVLSTPLCTLAWARNRTSSSTMLLLERGTLATLLISALSKENYLSF